MRRKSKHTLSCEHTICDTCLRIFEKLISIKDYRFFIRNCILCKCERIIAKYKSSTIEIRILFIDKSEIRNVVSLVFLNFLQKFIDSQSCLHDLFNLAFEINLSKMTYDFRRRALTY